MNEGRKRKRDGRDECSPATEGGGDLMMAEVHRNFGRPAALHTRTHAFSDGESTIAILGS